MWWPTKKILGFRWSKKAKIPWETISFWWNISISTFSFSLFLYIMKGCRWNLINFSKFTNALIRKEKKHSYSSQWENKNWAKVWLCFITSCFIKPFKMIIISFFISQASFAAQFLPFVIRMTQEILKVDIESDK